MTAPQALSFIQSNSAEESLSALCLVVVKVGKLETATPDQIVRLKRLSDGLAQSILKLEA